MDGELPTRRTFLMLGSGEFEAWSEEAERAALAGSVGDGSVLVVPTASASEGEAVFDRWGRMGLEHYAALGIGAEVLPVRTREDAHREDLATRVGVVSMLFFSGGKPRHLSSVIEGTPLWGAILAALDRGAVYAGCSAGAMVASQSRAGRDRRGAGWAFGLGLVPGVSFGVHWDRVRFIPGLRPFVMTRIPDGSWFVGIDERTAILGDGSRWRVFGRGSVAVRHAKATDSHRAGETFETR
jgi:cyanophycinase